MPSTSMLQAAGLNTFNNYLSGVPQGSLLIADNTVIDKQGVIEPRRGITQYGTIGTGSIDIAQQLLIYKNRILANYQNIIAWDDGTGNFTDYVGTFAETNAGLRLKYQEANSNLYVTTANGIMKISTDTTAHLGSAAITLAGPIKAITGTGRCDYTQPVFPGYSKVAYRITWSTTDINGNLIEGAPSPAIEITNQSAQECAFVITFEVPNGINTTYQYNIYRTDVVSVSPTSLQPQVDLAALDPGDEMRLVIQTQYTTGTTITVTDTTPNSFRDQNENLYTNEFSGEGILQANDNLPFATDIALYQTAMFFSNTRLRQDLLINFLGVGGLQSFGGVQDSIDISSIVYTAPNTVITFSANPSLIVGQKIVIEGSQSALDGVQTITVVSGNTITVVANGTGAVANTTSIYGSSITISNGTTSNTYYFVGRPAINNIVYPGKQSITDGGYFIMYSSENNNKYVIWADATGSTAAPSGPDTTGAIFVRVDLTAITLVGTQVEISATNVGTQGNITLITTGLASINTTIAAWNSANPGNTITLTSGNGAQIPSANQDITLSGGNATTVAAYIGAPNLNDNTPEGLTNAIMAAINAVSSDFVMSQSTTTSTDDTITFLNANSGAANPTVEGSVSFGATSITNIQTGQGENASLHYVRLSTYISAAQSIDDTARSLVEVITENTGEIINAYYIFSPSGLPGQMEFQAKDLTTTPFTVIGNNATTGALFSPNITTVATSDNSVYPNRLYYSKLQQPEAVPAENFIPVGPRDKAILRIIALRDSLFILKEEGIYRLTGQDSSTYTVNLFDNSAILLAPDSACVLNNQIYCLSTQGIISVSETGVSVISRPIEDTILGITSPLFTNYSTITFACGYESDRSYLIWIPSEDTDTTAQQCMRYNTFTNTWTSWSKSANCAVVNPFVNQLFTGATDTNLVEIERKELNRFDYADRQYAYVLGANSVVNSTTIQVPTTSLMGVGDSIFQVQYVTIAQVIRFANKLYLDPALPSTPGNDNKLYYKNFTLSIGVDLQTEVGKLITQLNSDTGGTFNTSYSSDFATFQTQYNSLITSINNSPLLSVKNYQFSNNTVPYEMLVQSVINNNTITVLTEEPFIQGPFTLYKAIASEVVWAPIFFGEPSILKHIRESTIMFDNAGLAFAAYEFNTDLSANFEGVNFLMEGDGSWGVFFYDSTTWGGQGTGRPFRTLIPRQKQRCRFIRSRFLHSTAFYKYGVIGISYAYEMGSERAYK